MCVCFFSGVASLLSYKISLLYSRQVRTKTFQNCYSYRIVSIRNNLPKDLRQEQTLTSFLRQLNIFYYLKFKDIFNSDNVCTWKTPVDVRRACDI